MNSVQLTSPKVSLDLRLPMTQVKTIMKNALEVKKISQDCLYIVTKATEMFIRHWAEQAFLKSNKVDALEYEHLSNVIRSSKNLKFLHYVTPKKITFKQFKEMMDAQQPEEIKLDLISNLSKSSDQSQSNNNVVQTGFFTSSESSSSSSSESDDDDESWKNSSNSESTSESD